LTSDDLELFEPKMAAERSHQFWFPCALSQLGYGEGVRDRQSDTERKGQMDGQDP